MATVMDTLNAVNGKLDALLTAVEGVQTAVTNQAATNLQPVLEAIAAVKADIDPTPANN